MATDSPGEEFVTIVPVGETRPATRDPAFVTVLTLGASAGAAKVVVRRPRGARLGLGLKFEGGSAAAEKVRRLLVQSCAEDSPAANATTPWGNLIPGDEILAIDGVSVSDLTRIDCVRRLKDSDEILTLLVRHFDLVPDKDKSVDVTDSTIKVSNSTTEMLRPTALPPPVPPRKLGKKNSFKDKPSLIMVGEQNTINSDVLKQLLSDKEINGNGFGGTVNSKLSRKSSFDSHLHRQNKDSIATLKRGSPEEVRRLVRRLSDGKTMPPEAEVYIDLLSSEWERCLALADAESDDTGSSISTVVDRLSSMASSVENSIPSTPVMQPKTIDIQKVLNCIENIDSDILKEITTNKTLEKQTETKTDIKLIEKCMNGNSSINNVTVNSMVAEEISTNAKKTFINDKNNNNTVVKNTNSFDIETKEPRKSEFKSDSNNFSPTEKPKPMPRNTKIDRLIEKKTKPTNSETSTPVTDVLLTPTKKTCIETWLQRSEAEMNDHEEETVPEALPRLIDFVPKPQFKECEMLTPLVRPTTAPPPPPAEAREDGSGASLDTIGELDEPNEVIEIRKENVTEPDTAERKTSFESSFWEDRVIKSDTEDKSLSNDETPPPTCPRQPPDGVENPATVVEKIDNVATSRLSITSGWAVSRPRLSYVSRSQDARSEASVKDKIAMFSNDKTDSSDVVDKCGTLPVRFVKKPNAPYSNKYPDVLSLDRRLTKSQDNLDDVPRSYKRHERPEVLGAIETITEKSINRPLHTNMDKKPLFYGSTTTLDSTPSPVVFHARSASDDSGKNVHKSNLEYLIEQRKKSMSKLRGLVIPEAQGPIVDLPEIKVQEQVPKIIMKSRQESKNCEKKTSKQNKNLVLNDTKWKSELLSNNIPKYSPAFKRKSLQVYSPSPLTKNLALENKPVLTSHLGTQKENKSIHTNSLRSNETRNVPDLYSNYTIPTRYSTLDYSKLEGKDILNELKNYNNVEIKICTATEIVDSDNDSAMSSTQSSYRSSASSPLHTLDSIESDSSRVSPRISHFTSYSLIKTEIPTKSLLTEKSCEEYVKRNVCRSVSSDTNASLSSSAGSAATSGSQASCSSLESSIPECDKKKAGKTYSIDTINRRNILASAKCRSGKDNKLNSPVIEAKFSHETYERSPSPQQKSSGRLSTLTSTVSALGNKGESRRRNKVIAETDSDSDSEQNVRQRKNDFKNTRLKRNSSASNKKQSDIVETTKIEEAPKAISERIIKEIKKAGLDNFNTFKNKADSDKSTVDFVRNGNERKLKEESKLPVPSRIKESANNKKDVDQTQVYQKILTEVKPIVFVADKEIIKTETSHISTQSIKLKKGTAAGVGLILAGGTDCEAKDVTVHRVLADSVADKAGLKRGAKVRSINGFSMAGLTHAQSVAILKEQRSEVVIEIEHESQENTARKDNHDEGESLSLKKSTEGDTTDGNMPGSSVVTVVLEKAGGGAGLGFGLDGGRDSPFGDRPLTVKKLFAGGAAARSGRIIVGAELLSAGGQLMEGYTRTQAWAALKSLPAGPVSLVLKNPAT